MLTLEISSYRLIPMIECSPRFVSAKRFSCLLTTVYIVSILGEKIIKRKYLYCSNIIFFSLSPISVNSLGQILHASIV
jgi:hypothetical protein